MANTVTPSDIADFLTDAAWAFVPHTTLYSKLSRCSNIWQGHAETIGNGHNTEREKQVDWDYKIGDRVLLRKEGILRKSESKYHKDPWTISTVHTNGTIRVHRNKIRKIKH
eukprot:CCRYP_005944-RA/>CCRYP_005944-RA protein AED:0.36 eAED:0.61 QI:0/0/0/1/0/0/2/0/110